MIYKTHITFSLSTSLLPFSTGIIQLDNIYYLPSIVITSYFFSLFPDFDEPNAYLSKRFPWILFSSVLSLFTKHRGITHRFLAPFIITLLFSPLFLYFKEYVFLIPVIFLSYLTHLIGDGFTKGGLKRFYYPFSKKTIWFLPKLLRFKTGSFIETFYFLLFSLISILEIYIIIQNILN